MSARFWVVESYCWRIHALLDRGKHLCKIVGINTDIELSDLVREDMLYVIGRESEERT